MYLKHCLYQKINVNVGKQFLKKLVSKKIFLSIRLRKNLFQKYLNLEYVEILVTGGKLIFFDIEGHSNTLSHPQLKMYFIFLDVSAIKIYNIHFLKK